MYKRSEGDVLRRFKLVSSLIASGNAERAEDRFPQAKTLYRRAMDLLEEQTGLTDLKVDCIRELSLGYVLQGDFRSATKVEHHLINSIREYLSAEDDSRVIDSTRITDALKMQYRSALIRMSVLYLLRRQPIAASNVADRLLNFCRAVSGPDNNDLVPVLNFTASLKHQNRQYAEAETLFRLSLDLQNDNILEARSKNMMRAMKGLGITLCAQGRPKRGQLYCNLACDQNCKEDGATIEGELFTLAQSRCRRDDFEGARDICEEAMKASYAEEPADLTGSLSNFATICHSLDPSFNTVDFERRIERLLSAA